MMHVELMYYVQRSKNTRGQSGLAAGVGRVQDAVDATVLVGEPRSRSGPATICTAALVACERAAGTFPSRGGGGGRDSSWSSHELHHFQHVTLFSLALAAR